MKNGNKAIGGKCGRMNKKAENFICAGFSLLIACILTVEIPVVQAADWALIPKLAVSGGYDDNLLFQSEDQISSSIVNVSPAIELDYDYLLSSMRLIADWDILSYLDESDLDRVNHYYRMDADYRLSQRWNSSVGFRYRKDTTLNSYLEETGRVIERLNRDYIYAMGGISYNISMVSWISTKYTYEKAQYEDDRYPDYDRHRLNLYYRHRLKSQQDILFIGPSYYHRTNDLNQTDYYSFDIGWERDWSDITNTIAAIGARYADVKNDEQDSDREDKSDWGVRARIELTRQGIASTTNFTYYHDVDTTADGTDINVDNFHLEYELLFTKRFSMGIEGRLVLSYNLFGNNDDEVNDRRYYDVRPFLRYRLMKNMNISLRYGYQNSSQDIVENENTRERNRVWIQLYYLFPDLL